MLVISSFVLGSSVAGAVDFVLYSQNTLHLGWGSKTTTKCTAFAGALTDVDIAVFQEVMVTASPCPGTAPLPGAFTWNASGPYGRGSYREYYLFLYRNTVRAGGPTIAYTSTNAIATHTGNFMRPPIALLFNVRNVTPNGSPIIKQVWIGNYHAIWGKSIRDRRTEVGNVAPFFTLLRNTCAPLPCNVIIGGDWNLPLTDTGFTALRNAGAAGEPNTATSLTSAGALSQPYDHFLYSRGSTLVASTYPGPTGMPLLTWRTTVSDHLGIMADVTLP